MTSRCHGQTSSTPRAPQHALSDPADVGELVAEAVTAGRFLVTTAPEIPASSSSAPSDLDGYLQSPYRRTGASVTTPMSAAETFRTVMTVDPGPVDTPFEAATREFLFGQVWNRPGLSVRDRRLVSLACVAVPTLSSRSMTTCTPSSEAAT